MILFFIVEPKDVLVEPKDVLVEPTLLDARKISSYLLGDLTDIFRDH